MILNNYGGLQAAMEKLRHTHPEAVVIGSDRHTYFQMISFLFVPLSVGAFPHIFAHWLSANRAESFRHTIAWYPVCIAAVWIPSVVLGAIGQIDYPPPLDGPILVKLILDNAGGVLAGCLAAGVFAAIMSSLDSQTLAVGTMFTHDIVRHYGFHDRLSEQRQVLFGRLFVMVLLAMAFGFSLITTRSIFSMGIWSLSGFAGLFPIFLAALYWKRSTKQGAIAAVVTVATLWVFFFVQATGVGGGYTVAGTGILPAAVMALGSSVAMVAVSLLSRPPETSVIARFFPEG